MDLEKELDRLYGLPLAEFVSARNDLARELGKEGESDDAAQVKALPKPSLPAWTVNQLARGERLQLRSLLTAGQRLRDAQAGLLRGEGADELQEAVQQQRQAVAALVESGRQVLQAAGHPATEATLERVRGTLTAAAADDEATKLLQAGRLTTDLDPAGFGAVVPGPPPRGKRALAKPKPRERREQARRRELEAAKRQVEALQAEARERKAEARRARLEAERADRAAAKAEAEAERLVERLEAAKEALKRARRS